MLSKETWSPLYMLVCLLVSSVRPGEGLENSYRYISMLGSATPLLWKRFSDETSSPVHGPA